MRPRAFLASLRRTVPLSSRRRLAGCGRPLAVLAALLAGGTLFAAALSLLGSRQPSAIFFAAADGLGSDPGVFALPVHEPSIYQEMAPPGALAALASGAFGIIDARPAIAAAGHLGSDGELHALVPDVWSDDDRSPLRVEIMGMEQLPVRLPQRPGASPR